MGSFEVSLFGVFLAPILPLMAVAYGVFVVLRRALVRRGLSRLIWHEPLFDLSLYVILLSTIVLAVALWGTYV